jgi:hypothetical protein
MGAGGNGTMVAWSQIGSGQYQQPQFRYFSSGFMARPQILQAGTGMKRPLLIGFASPLDAAPGRPDGYLGLSGAHDRPSL